MSPKATPLAPGTVRVHGMPGCTSHERSASSMRQTPAAPSGPMPERCAQSAPLAPRKSAIAPGGICGTGRTRTGSNAPEAGSRVQRPPLRVAVQSVPSAPTVSPVTSLPHAPSGSPGAPEGRENVSVGRSSRASPSVVPTQSEPVESSASAVTRLPGSAVLSSGT